MNDLESFLISTFGKENVLINEPMSKHTTFKTGGNADFYVVPNQNDDGKIIDTIKYCKDNNINFIVLGNGSNVLVRDEGIRGVVLSLKNFDYFEIEDDFINVGAGLSIAKASKLFAENGFAGLEFACGIPGTIGGAVFMNAGAYGGETKDVVETVTYLDLDDLKVYTISNEECHFEYRHSIFHELNAIILSCTLRIIIGEKDDIKNKIEENITSRNAKQPVTMPCAGSIFRREEGVIVAKLIDDAGLKGYRIGGAEVSTLHAGFIVNVGGATSQDILDLIEYIKTIVKEKYNVELHEEVRII